MANARGTGVHVTHNPPGTMTPGTGISTGTGTVYKYDINKVGRYITTRIFIDLTGLHGGGTANDIIGVDGGTANCHIGQITAAVNGDIIGGWIHCVELPAGGDPDIDLYSATVATGAQDALVTGLVETKLIDSGDWAKGETLPLIAGPAANEYLYLANGTATDAAYTAGQLVIELIGYQE